MRWHVVTTTNAAGWEETGRRMTQSFIERWPRDAQPLTVYAEGFTPDLPVAVRQLPPWLCEFKARHGATGYRDGAYHYTLDAVKFAHKVAALTDFGETLSDGVMIWLDADTFTHTAITPEWLEQLLPEPAYLAWLDRFGTHPETGFVMYRASHPHHRKFMAAYRALYTGGGLFSLPGYTDCHALQSVVGAAVWNTYIQPPASLSGAARRFGHVLANSPLSTRIDHMKGSRKGIGRTPKGERRLIQDGHPYWS